MHVRLKDDPGSRRRAKAPSRTASSSSCRAARLTDLLECWLEAVVATPGLTALRDLAEARRVLLDDALRGLELVQATGGPLVDVGSGGGTPGIPLAAALPGGR